jgi:hypothetical protein
MSNRALWDFFSLNFYFKKNWPHYACVGRGHSWVVNEFSVFILKVSARVPLFGSACECCLTKTFLPNLNCFQLTHFLFQVHECEAHNEHVWASKWHERTFASTVQGEDPMSLMRYEWRVWCRGQTTSMPFIHGAPSYGLRNFWGNPKKTFDGSKSMFAI